MLKLKKIQSFTLPYPVPDLPRYRKQQVNWIKYRLWFSGIKERPERKRNNCSGFYMGTYFRSQQQKGKPKRNTVGSETWRDGDRWSGSLEWQESPGRVPDSHTQKELQESATGSPAWDPVPDTALACDPCKEGHRKGELHRRNSWVPGDGHQAVTPGAHSLTELTGRRWSLVGARWLELQGWVSQRRQAAQKATEGYAQVFGEVTSYTHMRILLNQRNKHQVDKGRKFLKPSKPRNNLFPTGKGRKTSTHEASGRNLKGYSLLHRRS